MSTITIRTTINEKKLLQDLADFHGVSLSEFIRSKMLEIAEDEYDIRCADNSSLEYHRITSIQSDYK